MIQAAEVLSAVAEHPKSAELLAAAHNFGGVSNALDCAVKAANSALTRDLADVLLTVLQHVCSSGAPDAVSARLDKLIQAHHVQQLVSSAAEAEAGSHVAASESAAHEALAALAQTAKHSSWKTRLLLAPHKQVLQQALGSLELETAKERAILQRPPESDDDEDQEMVAHLHEADTELGDALTQPQIDLQQINHAVEEALQEVRLKLSQAKNNMHEIASQFAEQYAVYRALTKNYNGVGEGLCGSTAAAVPAGQCCPRGQKLTKISHSVGSDISVQQRVEVGKQLRQKCEELMASLGELVSAADAVAGFEKLLNDGMYAFNT